MSAAFLLVFSLLFRWLTLKSVPFLSPLGKNPLVIFMIASVLTKVLNAVMPGDAGAAATLAVAIGLEAACIAMAVLLSRKKVFVKL